MARVSQEAELPCDSRISPTIAWCWDIRDSRISSARSRRSSARALVRAMSVFQVSIAADSEAMVASSREDRSEERASSLLQPPTAAERDSTDSSSTVESSARTVTESSSSANSGPLPPLACSIKN